MISDIFPMQSGLFYRTAINFMPWMNSYHVEIDMPWHDGRDTEFNNTLGRIYTYSGVNRGGGITTLYVVHD